MATTIQLPWLIQRRLESAAAGLFRSETTQRIDFTQPPGEAALAAADSVSWRVFKNPVSLFIGGVAAVILELAEPRIRAAIWEHSSYRRDPLPRLRRTGLAAMITVYGARTMAEPMITKIVRMHSKVTGTTPGGIPYSAADPELITWVHATAAFGFVHAYDRFVERLSVGDIDRFFLEGVPAARLYGSPSAPHSRATAQDLFDDTIAALDPSPAILSFLCLMGDTPAFPLPLLWLQRLLVRAAVEVVPESIRRRLQISADLALRPRERWAVACAARLADKILLMESPAVQACRRLGLPANHLYR